MKYNEIYQQLKKEYEKEEIVDSMLIPADLSDKERSDLDIEMRQVRLQRMGETNDEDRILSDVMRLRFQIENYINKENFSFEKSFGKYLQEYIRVLKKTRKEFSEDIDLHYTKLSRIINDREEPNLDVCYRLEYHSGGLVKADHWWQLIVKKQRFIISKDEKAREAQQRKVKNALRA